mgnify:FL=1
MHLLYGVLEETDIITRSVRIKNTGTGQITIEKAAAACLDFVQGEFDVLRFYGKHAMERNLERTPLGHGTIAFGSRRGTSSHQYNPAVILAEKGTTETAGSCYGMLFVYSGNFSCEAEKDQFNQTRLLLGLNEELFSYPLAAGETFTVPEVILSYSADGLSALSQQYHNCIRNHVCRSKYVHMQRPVLINSWEAAYFDFTGDTIVDLAKEAASLGIDMVVMDDGWFGKRNDDNSSLGDWQVNEKKLGGSLAELISRVHEQGVKFGIWIEPEMVNEDSDLYRAHPDFKSYFDRILTAEFFSRSKPEPDCYLLGAEVFGLPVTRCVVFEDSFNGLKAGRAAGMKVVGLSTTNAPEQIQDLCDRVIPDFRGFDVEKLLEMLA